MRKALRILTLIGLGSLALSAQIGDGLTANIPFSFHAGQQILPPGTYRLTNGGASSAILVRSADGKAGAFVLSQRTVSSRVRDRSSVVFNRYGDRYYLSEIRVQGSDSGVRFKPTTGEKAAAQEVASVRESVVAANTATR